MKLLVLTALIIAVIIFLASYSFGSYFSGLDYAIPQPPAAPTPEPGGGSPRNSGYAPVVSSSAAATSTGFRGPSGPPHIIGPGSPPPGQ
jgi:hypothetical protein